MTEDATQRGEPDPIWTQRAGFSVLFDCMATPTAQEVWRTRIYHDETGEETVLAGANALRWPRWIMARLVPHRKPDGESAGWPSTADPTTVHEVAVEIVEVRLLDRRTEGPRRGQGPCRCRRARTRVGRTRAAPGHRGHGRRRPPQDHVIRCALAEAVLMAPQTRRSEAGRRVGASRLRGRRPAP